VKILSPLLWQKKNAAGIASSRVLISQFLEFLDGGRPLGGRLLRP
jgi:hypothetical protein